MKHWFNAAHCDAEGCDTWSLTPQEHGFLALHWGGSVSIYCSTDHLLRDVAARSTPLETFTFDV